MLPSSRTGKTGASSHGFAMFCRQPTPLSTLTSVMASRSKPVDEIGSVVLPAYRGHMVNAPEGDAHSRRPDPLHMLMCFTAARAAMQHLGWRADDDWAQRDIESRVWTSHEALLLDYEEPLLRRLDGAHVDLLSRAVNQVACQIGSAMTPAELLDPCNRLDPYREPG